MVEFTRVDVVEDDRVADDVVVIDETDDAGGVKKSVSSLKWRLFRLLL